MSDQNENTVGGFIAPDPVPPSYGVGYVAYRKHDPSWNDEQQLTYTWYTQRFPRLNPNGTISTSMPSPMTRAQIEPVLVALAAHPGYKNFSIVIHDSDYEPVLMREGKIVDAKDNEDGLMVLTPDGKVIDVLDPQEGIARRARVEHDEKNPDH